MRLQLPASGAAPDSCAELPQVEWMPLVGSCVPGRGNSFILDQYGPAVIFNEISFFMLLANQKPSEEVVSHLEGEWIAKDVLESASERPDIVNASGRSIADAPELSRYSENTNCTVTLIDMEDGLNSALSAFRVANPVAEIPAWDRRSDPAKVPALSRPSRSKCWERRSRHCGKRARRSTRSPMRFAHSDATMRISPSTGLLTFRSALECSGRGSAV